MQYPGWGSGVLSDGDEGDADDVGDGARSAELPSRVTWLGGTHAVCPSRRRRRRRTRKRCGLWSTLEPNAPRYISGLWTKVPVLSFSGLESIHRGLQSVPQGFLSRSEQL